MNRVQVMYRIDSDMPLQSAHVQYEVSATKTQIVFPNGDTKSFDNWDVKGVRKSFYEDEVMKEHPVDDTLIRTSLKPSKKELVEFGIKASDVQRFVAQLAEKPQYEHLFDPQVEFQKIINVLAKGASASA